MLLHDFLTNYFSKKYGNIQIEINDYHPCKSCIKKEKEYESINYECGGCNALYISSDSEVFVIFEDFDKQFKIRLLGRNNEEYEEIYSPSKRPMRLI